MEFEQGLEPVSPIAQYCNSSAITLSIIGVCEFAVPIDEAQIRLFVRDYFISISPRFSSIMVGNENEKKRWKKTVVKLEDHIYIPDFQSNLSLESCDRCLDDYISEISVKGFPQDKPLWEIHIIKYPTTTAASSLVFRLHHALGDGYSIMSAVLSILPRADNPSLPLTFPSRQRSRLDNQKKTMFYHVPQVFFSVFQTASDFGWNILKSSLIEDDRTPIRSGNNGVEFDPTTMTSIFFSIDQIKLIKNKLGATINDVVCGIIFLGTRLYMHEIIQNSDNSQSTALVLLNTRRPGEEYKPLKEMNNGNAKTNKAWGNRFAFLHVEIPKLSRVSNPLDFIFHSKKEINRKRSPLAVFLNTKLWGVVDKLKGPEAAARFVHSTVRNASMTISNMIGPLDQLALGDYPLSGIYFASAGLPEDLGITVISYMEKIRVVLKMRKEHMDPKKLKSCVENAFEIVFKASANISTAKM
ncbi:hypothetical protein FEM48_Zijuj04G0122600 [Ziziphus jujuba var. spinosa]|uniref:Diacylglycerol O-acyltransferase n=1 Tax=Ziziphus jujuba var. spinosa TaxID=714518 RepID=A0A978VJU1_ZIZJJ|nr:hypothetical protein FEM48_Zijuj04G0122600 [Ziziphus jujuba var. spinosa]